MSHLSSYKAAKLLGVTPAAVRSLVDRGQLPACRTPGGHRRIPKAAFRRFLVARGMPVPRELACPPRLVLVDDEPSFLRAMRRLFASEAPSVELSTAEGPEEGLVKIGTLRPDAVVVDACMPEMDGVAVCQRIHEQLSAEEPRVVALTGYPSRELEQRFLRAGAVGFLTKPLQVTALLRLLGWSARAPRPRARG